MADYAEVRRKKLEENKKRLELLNLGHLSTALRASTTPKSSPAKQVKRKAPQEEFVVARRSTRIANLPEQTYKEVFPEALLLPRRVFKQRRDLSGRVYASDEAREYAQTKAEELES
ncbi:B3 domain-containing protein-like isoform X2 [Iris pallida]|uniref:B3 domain-containing protein-like isoform X2 n=1 Tax=Iris pallida TaxID=29817 RepID=A0AAX6DUG0_IRIPA|nr:B3 domain-containing protein-like isoform X2 [Iris pallida]